MEQLKFKYVGNAVAYADLSQRDVLNLRVAIHDTRFFLSDDEYTTFRFGRGEFIIWKRGEQFYIKEAEDGETVWFIMGPDTRVDLPKPVIRVLARAMTRMTVTAELGAAAARHGLGEHWERARLAGSV